MENTENAAALAANAENAAALAENAEAAEAAAAALPLAPLLLSSALFLLIGGLFVFCLIKSRGLYDEYLEAIDKKEFALKDLFPLGMYCHDMALWSKIMPSALSMALGKYNNTVYAKVLEIRGPQYAKFYMIVHNGFRLTVGLLAGAFFALVGLVKTAQDGSGATLSVLALLLAAGMPFFVDNSLNDAIKKRRLEIRMEFPEFVNKLTLLVNAGMTISHAWKKIVDDNKKDTALYREMGHAMAEISAGKPEAVAYEELARRCNIKEVTKVVSIIIINLKRGGTEVVMSLKQQGDECWEMRKAAARQLGEEASTKILFPLMIMFMGIIIIVATPAVLAIAGGT